MKHILIYLVIAIGIFGLLGWYFTQQEDLQPQTVVPSDLTMNNLTKQSQTIVKMLFNDMSDEEKNSFRIALQSELDGLAEVEAHDCMGSAEVQLAYAKRVLDQGCSLLMLEPVNETVADNLLAMAQEYGVPVVLMNHRATSEQLAAYSNLYSIIKAEDTEEAELTRLADTIAEYWKTNREQLNFRLYDGKLGIAAVTEYGFEESGKWEKLQAMLEERDCNAILSRDVVTEYLNYNLEPRLDAIHAFGGEMLLFSDSADAEKAYSYYRDPTEYPSGNYKPYLVVMEADETAYNLYKDGKILFAEGGGGYMMGKAAAQMVKLLLNGETPRVSIQLATPADGGKTYICNTVVLRNTIVTEEPEEEKQEQKTVKESSVGIS